MSGEVQAAAVLGGFQENEELDNRRQAGPARPLAQVDPARVHPVPRVPVETGLPRA